MAKQKWPTKLNKEPLIDAIFEVRFQPGSSISSFLPGYLHSRLEGAKQLERLPVADIPAAIRQADEGLKYQALLRMRWEGYLILIGDASIGVAPLIPPYPGWRSFKEKILQVMQIVAESSVATSPVQRYSMKYLDLIEGGAAEEQIRRFNVTLNVGGHALRAEPFQVRIEIQREGILHLVQIGGPAIGQTVKDGKRREGYLLDIDSIQTHNEADFGRFMRELPDRIEALHASNKEMFFSALSDEGMTYLEPVYEQ